MGGFALSCHCFENSFSFLVFHLVPLLDETQPHVPHTIPPATPLSVDVGTSQSPSVKHTIQMATVHNRTQRVADVTSTTPRLLICAQRWEPNGAAVLVTVSRTDDEVCSSASIVQHRRLPTPLLRHLKCGTVTCTLARVPRRAFADALQQLLL